MKNKSLLLLSFLFCSTLLSAHTYRVLFLGNSLTYVNNVPDLVAQIALSHGDTIVWDSNTPGGHTLLQHASNPVSLTKISDRRWDYVIIQAQSQETAFPDGQLETDIYPPAKFLTDSIHRHNACTRVLFYMPAGWKYGDNGNCPSYPVICTYDGQFERIRQTHLNIVDSTQAGIVPSGISYHRARAIDSTIDLWSSDFVHPSIKGSYLTALNIYAAITQSPTTGTTYMPSGVSTVEADFLQHITDTVVFDSLAQWKIDSAPLHDSIGFDFQLNYLTEYRDANGFDLSNTNTSLDSVFYIIHLDNQFGGGYVLDTVLAMPRDSSNIHFAFNDTISFCFRHYLINQIQISSCGIDTSTQEFSDVCESIQDLSSISKFNIYPNPSKDFISIENIAESMDAYQIQIINMQGAVLINNRILAKENKKIIDLSALSSGVYTIRFYNDKETINKKMIIQ